VFHGAIVFRARWQVEGVGYRPELTGRACRCLGMANTSGRKPPAPSVIERPSDLKAQIVQE